MFTVVMLKFRRLFERALHFFLGRGELKDTIPVSQDDPHAKDLPATCSLSTQTSCKHDDLDDAESFDEITKEPTTSAEIPAKGNTATQPPTATQQPKQQAENPPIIESNAEDDDEFERLFLEEFGPPPKNTTQKSISETSLRITSSRHVHQKIQKEKQLDERLATNRETAEQEDHKSNVDEEAEFERLFLQEFGPPPITQRSIQKPLRIPHVHQLKKRKEEQSRKSRKQAKPKTRANPQSSPVLSPEKASILPQPGLQYPDLRDLENKFSLLGKKHCLISTASRLPKEEKPSLSSRQQAPRVRNSTDVISTAEPLRLSPLCLETMQVGRQMLVEKGKTRPDPQTGCKTQPLPVAARARCTSVASE